MSSIHAETSLTAQFIPSKELEEQLDRLESRYELFKIEFFAQYRWCVAFNSIVAGILAVLLIIIAIKAETNIEDSYERFVVLAVGLSLLPSPIILGPLVGRKKRRASEEVGRPLTRTSSALIFTR